MPTPMHIFAELAAQFGVDPKDQKAIDDFFSNTVPRLSRSLQEGIMKHLLIHDGEPPQNVSQAAPEQKCRQEDPAPCNKITEQFDKLFNDDGTIKPSKYDTGAASPEHDYTYVDGLVNTLKKANEEGLKNFKKNIKDPLADEFQKIFKDENAVAVAAWKKLNFPEDEEKPDGLPPLPKLKSDSRPKPPEKIHMTQPYVNAADPRTIKVGPTLQVDKLKIRLLEDKIKELTNKFTNTNLELRKEITRLTDHKRIACKELEDLRNAIKQGKGTYCFEGNDLYDWGWMPMIEVNRECVKRWGFSLHQYPSPTHSSRDKATALPCPHCKSLLKIV